MECKTICVKCKYHKRDRSAHAVWQHLCNHPAVRLEKKQNPVTGEWAYDYSEKPQPFCNQINHGDCEHYEHQNVLQRVFKGE